MAISTNLWSFVGVLRIRALLSRAWRHMPALVRHRPPIVLMMLARAHRTPASCAQLGRDFALGRQILWNISAGGFRTLKHEQQVRHCAYDVGVPCARASTIGAPFLRLGGRYASFQIARFQRITTPPPEPSLCASEVLLMLLMRFS